MSERRHRRLRLALSIASLVLCALPMYGSQTTVAIGGSEQFALPTTWDGGSLSLTVDGHTETIGYGQFSTAQSVASGLAAKFSLDCSSPVSAKASGAAITFTTKRPDETFEQVSATAVWNTVAFSRASFGIPQSPTATAGLTPSLDIACTPDPVPSGGSADCTARLPAGATGTVSFALDGQAASSTAVVDGAGWAPAGTLSGLQPGTHTLLATYSGDGTYNTTTQTLSLPVLTGSLASSTVYSYSITSYDADSNILGYNDQVNGQWSQIQYDNLNRLGGATAVVSGTTQNWCWSYDSFGNRTLESTSTSSIAAACANTNSSTANPATPTPNNQLAGLVYDAAGNVTFDGTNSYAYDGDGRLCAMASHPPSGGTVAYQYIYDADGQRVAKGTIQLISVNGVSTLSCDTTQNSFTPTNSYILGQDGEQVTEMTVVAGQPVWAHSNVYAGGILLATYDPQGLHFQLADWLGSRRVQTNAFGQVEEDCLNSPFGNGLNCTFPANAPTTADDATEHHFTGQQRDTESGNDYFGARYFESGMGRFLSPDDGSDQDPTDPQSWNLYAYVRNGPLTYLDPDGHDCTYTNGDGGGAPGLCAGPSQDPTTQDDGGCYYNGPGTCPGKGGFWHKFWGSFGGGDGGGERAAFDFTGGGGAANRGQKNNTPRPAPINIPKLIFNAQNNLLRGCNQAFANGIPHYTNANFFEQLLINPIVQMPNPTSPSDPDFGHDAVTSPNTGQITLRSNFFSLPAFYQQMTLVHEGIHSYTGWNDAQVMSKLNIPNDGNGTSAITDWITGGCKSR